MFLELKLGRVVRESEVLCYSCLFGHVQRGFAVGEESIQCTFGYGMRYLPFLVRECSDYSLRPTGGLSCGTGFVQIRNSAARSVGKRAD